MDTYTYPIGNNLYVNLTNRCSNRCTFCVRDQNSKYEGYSLWLEKEPTAEEVIALIGDPKRYGEIVFCGYGEPTYRLDAMKEIARYVKEQGGRTRLNTNGHANLIHGRDVASELKEIDLVNISLNTPDKASYDALCRPCYLSAFEAVLSFARACKQSGVACRFSVVDCIGGEAVSACKAIAGEIGVPLYVREMIDNSEQ